MLEMNYEQAISWLYSLGPHKTDLGLDKVKCLLEKLGNPHKTLNCIHVAGTNGKGSVCAMVSTILTKAGYTTGMYTSPHLISFSERIQINGKPISNKDLAALVKKIKPRYKGQTFFEVITTLAFLYFKQNDVDYLVLEVGLGGRLDATNVVEPLLSIITNIDIEHTEYLGKTKKEIAFEKAGIIKKKKPALTGAKGVALEVIKKKAKESNSDLSLAKEHKGIKTNLNGAFQKQNANIAATAVEMLNRIYGLNIKADTLKKALMSVDWPGRFQLIKKNILVDCAHNPAAAKELRKEIVRIKGKKVLVIGMLKDKDYRSFVDVLAPLFEEIVVTKPKIIRSVDPRKIAEKIKVPCTIKEDVKEAFHYAASKPGRLVVVAGSIYVVREVLL